MNSQGQGEECCMSYRTCSAYKLANLLPGMLFLMQHWMWDLSRPIDLCIRHKPRRCEATGDSLLLAVDMLAVSGVQPCMFGQAGQNYHVLQLRMHIYIEVVMIVGLTACMHLSLMLCQRTFISGRKPGKGCRKLAPTCALQQINCIQVMTVITADCSAPSIDKP